MKRGQNVRLVSGHFGRKCGVFALFETKPEVYLSEMGVGEAEFVTRDSGFGIRDEAKL